MDGPARPPSFPVVGDGDGTTDGAGMGPGMGAGTGVGAGTGGGYGPGPGPIAAGTPILGDAKYGASARSTAPPGLMLHAREVHLPLAGRKPLSIAADPPKSFTAGLAWLGLGPERLPYTAIADWDVAP